MGWALWEKNDCRAALTAMRKMSTIPSGAHRMLAGIYACLGNEREAKEALAVFLKDSPGESISKERKEWEKIMDRPREPRPLDQTHADRGVAGVTADRMWPGRRPIDRKKSLKPSCCKEYVGAVPGQKLLLQNGELS